jgi:hypothetical protein
MGNLGEELQKLPERINAMKVASYDVQEIVGYISDGLDKPVEEITLEDVLEWIEDDVNIDIAGCNVIFQNENGEEL